MGYFVRYVDGDSLLPYTERFSAGEGSGDKTVFVCRPEDGAAKLFDSERVVRNPAEAAENPLSPLVLFSGQPDARAVKLAARLWARECVIYTRRGGVYTMDDSRAGKGNLIDRLDYDEALEMRAGGYGFLSAATIEAAKRNGVTLRLLPFSGEGEGTVIKEVLGVGGKLIKGVIKDPNVCIISLTDIPDVVGISYRIFQAVSDAGIVVDIISLPASGSGKQDISFTVRRDDRRKTERVLKIRQKNLGFSDVVINDSVAKVSVVGAALRSGRGVAAAMFRVLYENNISLRLINTSEIKISVIIDRRDADLAVIKIHENFIDGR